MTVPLVCNITSIVSNAGLPPMFFICIFNHSNKFVDVIWSSSMTIDQVSSNLYGSPIYDHDPLPVVTVPFSLSQKHQPLLQLWPAHVQSNPDLVCMVVSVQ